MYPGDHPETGKPTLFFSSNEKERYLTDLRALAERLRGAEAARAVEWQRRIERYGCMDLKTLSAMDAFIASRQFRSRSGEDEN